MDDVTEMVRVDQWLWAIRIFKTRSSAQDACRGGHVKVNGASAKPATPVRPGDRVDALAHGWHRELEVVRVIAKRVGAPVAVECYVDHSGPPPARDHLPPLFSRSQGAGRPTKRDRRRLDDLRKG